MGDQVISNHLLGLITDFFRGFADLHSALESTSQFPFASAASLHLTFQDESALVAEGTRYLLSFFWSHGQLTFLDIHAELTHDIL